MPEIDFSEPANVQAVDMVYASALYELADQAGAAVEVADELAQLKGLIRSSDQLMPLISARTIAIEDRTAIIDRLFKGRVSDLLYRFLQVISRKQRLDRLPDVIDGFEFLLDQKRGVIKVDAYLAKAMSETQAQRVADDIGAAVGRKVELNQHVDPQLIGGLKLRIGDREIDGSVVTQLKLIREKLIAQGREKARLAARA